MLKGEWDAPASAAKPEGGVVEVEGRVRSEFLLVERAEGGAEVVGCGIVSTGEILDAIGV